MDKTIYFVVTPFFPTPTSWRGPFCYDFVKALQRTGKYRVLVFKEGDGSDYEIGGVKVYTFKAKRLPSNIFPFLFKRYNQRSFLRKVNEVLSSYYPLTTNHYDSITVVHAHTANYGIYALAMKKANPKCKTLLHHHDPQSFGLNAGVLRHCWLYNMIQFPILRRMFETIDCHVFISEMVKRSFLAAPNTSWTKYDGYKKQMRWLPYRPVGINDSIILHNGVDKSVFNEVEGCRSKVERRKSDSFVIGCVGNFVDWKDQMTLLRAVDSLKFKVQGLKLKVVFVGSGETLEECKRFAGEKGIDAEFLTEMRHEQLPDFYRSLDLFVLPSYFEGFGCVFTEAHSCGVPFITCEGQGVDDLIPEEDRNKWLCKQQDPKDLAMKIGDYICCVERGERVEQRLNEEQDIDKLVRRFVEEIFL